MKRTYNHKCAACGEYAFDYHEGSHSEAIYQWVCNTCGVQMQLRFFDGGQRVEQSPTGKRYDRTLALLRLRNNPSFMFIYEGSTTGGDFASRKYFYEEHTCPINLMRCVEIISDGKDDPHGVFELVEEQLISGPNGAPRDSVLEKLRALAVDKTSVVKVGT